jgi:hypothetical protein
MSLSIRRAFRPSFERLERRDAPSAFGTGAALVVRREVVEFAHHHRRPEHRPEIHRHEVNDHRGEAEAQDDNGQHGEGGAHA